MATAAATSQSKQELSEEKDAQYERKDEDARRYEKKEYNGRPLGHRGEILPALRLISIRWLRGQHHLHGRQCSRNEGKDERKRRDETTQIIAVVPMHFPVIKSALVEFDVEVYSAEAKFTVLVAASDFAIRYGSEGLQEAEKRPVVQVFSNVNELLLLGDVDVGLALYKMKV